MSLRVSHDDVLDRILAGIDRTPMTSESVARIIEKATALVEASLQNGELERDRDRLAAISRKLQRTIDVYTEEDDHVAAERIKREITKMRDERRRLRERVAAADAGPRLDAAAIRAGLAQMAEDVRGRIAADMDDGREAILALIAESGGGRLDVIEDASAPGGYRLDGKLLIPIVLNGSKTEERRSDRLRPAPGERYAPVESTRSRCRSRLRRERAGRSGWRSLSRRERASWPEELFGN